MKAGEQSQQPIVQMLGQMLSGKFTDKKRKYIEEILKGEKKMIRVKIPLGKISKDKKSDFKILNKSQAVASIQFVYILMLSVAAQSKLLNLQFEIDESGEMITHETNIIEQFIINKEKYEKIYRHENKSLEQYFILAEQKQRKFSQLQQISIQFGDVNLDKCLSKKLIFFLLLTSFFSFISNFRLSKLRQIKIDSGTCWQLNLFSHLIGLLDKEILKIVFSPQNFSIEVLKFPFICQCIYQQFQKELRLNREQQAENQNLKDKKENQFYRVQEISISGFYRSFNNHQIKILLNQFLCLFPNLTKLRITPTLEEKSFQILAQNISTTNPLLEELIVEEIGGQNDKIKGLKMLMINSPYLFNLLIPFSKTNAQQNREQKQIVQYMASKCFYIQKCLSTIKLLKKQNLSQQNIVNILKRYKNFRFSV